MDWWKNTTCTIHIGHRRRRRQSEQWKRYTWQPSVSCAYAWPALATPRGTSTRGFVSFSQWKKSRGCATCFPYPSYSKCNRTWRRWERPWERPCSKLFHSLPIGSMYAIYANIYHQYTPNVSIYTIHGSYGLQPSCFCFRTKNWV